MHRFKNEIMLETDVFYEDETMDTLKVISYYFDIQEVDMQSILSIRERYPEKFPPRYYRGSLNNARLMKLRFEYANAMKWVPAFREHMFLPRETYFVELGYIKKYFGVDQCNRLFARPCDGFKEFAGQVFTRESFGIEYSFLKQQKNTPDDLMCMISPVVELKNEYRCIFVNNEYVAGSQYMRNSSKFVERHVPEGVIAFAKQRAKHDLFLNVPNFVIDIGTAHTGRATNDSKHNPFDSCYVIEVNAFETASFYAANLHAIYQAYANT